MQPKKILFVHRKMAYGQSQSQELLDILLMAASFDQKISVLFMDDGVFLLKTQQNPSLIQQKNFTLAYKALPLYEIDQVYVEAESLDQRRLQPSDLMMPVCLIRIDQIHALFSIQDAIISM